MKGNGGARAVFRWPVSLNPPIPLRSVTRRHCILAVFSPRHAFSSDLSLGKWHPDNCEWKVGFGGLRCWPMTLPRLNSLLRCRRIPRVAGPARRSPRANPGKILPRIVVARFEQGSSRAVSTTPGSLGRPRAAGRTTASPGPHIGGWGKSVDSAQERQPAAAGSGG
jgi:hypothetical protein